MVVLMRSSALHTSNMHFRYMFQGELFELAMQLKTLLNFIKMMNYLVLSRRGQVLSVNELAAAEQQ